MAGKRGPWGGPPKNKGDDSADEPGDEPAEPTGEGSDGPRNPWLPTGEEPRRSANIEDIFRQRGPEGPRRKGGGPRGPNFRLPQRPGGKSWLPIGIGIIAALWLGVSMVHQVEAKQQGIVTTFGSFSRTLNPGLNFTLPWPIQNVEVESVSEVRLVRIPEDGGQKLILTADQNLVDLSYLVRWSIKDLKQFRYQLADPIATVSETAEAAMRASVAERTLDDTMSGAGRAAIEERVSRRMQAVLDAYRSGVAVQGVEIDKTDPPERVVEAFKDVSAAEQDADAARNRARQYSAQVLARALGEAEAFSQVYEEYRLAPEVTRRRMYYETMERVLRDTDKTVVEAEGVTPYLPLPELRRRAASAPPAAGTMEGQ
ncbi:MAG TPA: protease modulator HflK [Alteraurantiacibacter sp.]